MPSFTALDAKRYNDQTLGNLAEIQKRVDPDHFGNHEKDIDAKADRTLTGIGVMCWATFALGVILIVTSLLLFVIQGKTLDVLGLGGLGLADVVAILLYRPMDRLQEADANYAEQLMIVRGWALGVNLQLLAMDSSDAASVRQTASAIQSATEEYSKILGGLLPSAASSAGSASAAPKAPAGAAGGGAAPAKPGAPSP